MKIAPGKGWDQLCPLLRSHPMKCDQSQSDHGERCQEHINWEWWDSRWTWKHEREEAWKAESGASKWQNSSQCKCFKRRKTDDVNRYRAGHGHECVMNVWEGRVLSRTELWIANRGREKVPHITATDKFQCCIYYVLLIPKCRIQHRKILKSLTVIQNIV